MACQVNCKFQSNPPRLVMEAGPNKYLKFPSSMTSMTGVTTCVSSSWILFKRGCNHPVHAWNDFVNAQKNHINRCLNYSSKRSGNKFLWLVNVHFIARWLGQPKFKLAFCAFTVRIQKGENISLCLGSTHESCPD